MSINPASSNCVDDLSRKPREPTFATLAFPTEGPRPLPIRAERAAPTTYPHTRGFAFVALCTVLTIVGYVAYSAYLAITDSFVAPMILSPDSDMVVEHKAKITELEMQRASAIAESEGLVATLASTEKGLTELVALRSMASNALEWTRNVNAHRASAGAAEASSLAQQASALVAMIARQRALTDRARAHLQAGIITSAEYQEHEQSLDQMKLALLENGRIRAQLAQRTHEVQLGQRSLATADGSPRDAPPMPEVIAAQDQLVRVELEILKLQAEKDAKVAERRAVEERIAKIDELCVRLKSRPVFLAIEKHLDVAFVPYTQLDGVKAGAKVFRCALGFFACRDVGTIAEVLAGEVTLPDPWGNPSRGQYAVLNLRDSTSAREKSLRVRVGVKRER